MYLACCQVAPLGVEIDAVVGSSAWKRHGLRCMTCMSDNINVVQPELDKESRESLD